MVRVLLVDGLDGPEADTVVEDGAVEAVVAGLSVAVAGSIAVVGIAPVAVAFDVAEAVAGIAVAQAVAVVLAGSLSVSAVD